MSLQIPDYPFQAYIFDCDGTLVDSMPLHYIAWVEALKQQRNRLRSQLRHAKRRLEAAAVEVASAGAVRAQMRELQAALYLG